MKKLLTIFSVLLIMGACTTAPTSQSPLDSALSDALAQIGSVDGMTAYKSEQSNKDADLEIKVSQMMYVSANAYKTADSVLYNGTAQLGPDKTEQFNNEIVTKSAAEGSLAKATTFTLVDSKGTTITDKKGYTTLYTLTPTKSMSWGASKAGGTDKWETDPAERLYTQYYIVKESNNELSIIYVNKSEDNYRVYPDITEAEKQSTVYKKQ